MRLTKPRIAAVSRIGAWALASLITILTVVPPSLRPETPAPHNMEHFAIFAAAGFAFGMAYANRLMAYLIALVAFAGGLELVQTVIPGRHARWSDFAVDAIAIALANVCGALVYRKWPDPRLAGSEG